MFYKRLLSWTVPYEWSLLKHRCRVRFAFNLCMLTLTLPGLSAGVSESLDSYCSLNPYAWAWGKQRRLVPRRPYFPHPLALCCHYPVSKCCSASIVVTGTVRVNPPDELYCILQTLVECSKHGSSFTHNGLLAHCNMMYPCRYTNSILCVAFIVLSLILMSLCLTVNCTMGLKIELVQITIQSTTLNLNLLLVLVLYLPLTYSFFLTLILCWPRGVDILIVIYGDKSHKQLWSVICINVLPGVPLFCVGVLHCAWLIWGAWLLDNCCSWPTLHLTNCCDFMVMVMVTYSKRPGW